MASPFHLPGDRPKATVGASDHHHPSNLETSILTPNNRSFTLCSTCMCIKKEGSFLIGPINATALFLPITTPKCGHNTFYCLEHSYCTGLIFVFQHGKQCFLISASCINHFTHPSYKETEGAQRSPLITSVVIL